MAFDKNMIIEESLGRKSGQTFCSNDLGLYIGDLGQVT